jgi:hypothetical protein
MIDRSTLSANVAELMRSVARTELLPRLAGAAQSATLKSPGEVVTEADVAAERALAAGLRGFLSGAAFVGEESAHADPSLLDGLHQHEWTWVVDPLDGTRHFAGGDGPFGIMVALLHRGECEGAWIHTPLTGDMATPRESFLPLLEQIVFSGKIEFDPSRNDFPVTLHDPCNIVRNLGIVEPQRRILRYLCPQFREMTPHGVDNYCCGGGSGMAIMSPNNFEDWRVSVGGRVKFKQILDAFADEPGPEVQKYVCAPCSNCKGQIRDMLNYYGALDKSGITYGGLVELIVNAMVDVKQPFIKWEMH